MTPHSESSMKVLRLGARGSLLSRLQSGLVARALEEAHPGLRVELVIVSTSGDVIQDRPLHEFGGKGLFTKELEQALLRGEVDFAVHSFKDVPVTMPLVDIAELEIAAVPAREDPRDVLACNVAKTIAELPRGAKVGTGSLRRQAQILALRPDVTVLPIRGNVDTRIRKLKDGEYDAVILAAAGLKRAGLFDAGMMTPLPYDQLLPAAGQGALALQCRRDAAHVREILSALHHPDTAHTVAWERMVVQLLEGDCHSPIAALAELYDGKASLSAVVAARDGHPPLIRSRAANSVGDAGALASLVVAKLNRQGADKLLKGGA